MNLLLTELVVGVIILVAAAAITFIPLWFSVWLSARSTDSDRS